MIDKKITINKIEDLLREVARVEFSNDFPRNITDTAMTARVGVELLVNVLRRDLEKDDN